MPEGLPLRLLLPDGVTADVLELKPEGADYKLGLVAGKKKLRLKASALPRGTTEAATGEVIDNPVQFFRRAWCTEACARHGGWRLEDLINALPIKGIGPSTAAKISSSLGSWDRFLAATEQLRRIEVPESRDDIVVEQMERAYRSGQGKEISRMQISSLPGAAFVLTDLSNVKPDPLYPEPLQTLIDCVGPQKWKLLRQWAASATRERDVAELLSFGKPLVSGLESISRAVGGNAAERAQNLIPNLDRLAEVPPFYIEYEGPKQPRPRLVKLVSAHVDSGFVPVLQCFSYEDKGERFFRLDKILAVLDERGNVLPLPTFWKSRLGVDWRPPNALDKQ
jgi:hypothetical protein